MLFVDSMKVMQLFGWREQQILEFIDEYPEVKIFNRYGEEIINIKHELDKQYIVIRQKMLSNVGKKFGVPSYFVDMFSSGYEKKMFEEEVFKLAKINFARSLYFLNDDIEIIKNNMNNGISSTAKVSDSDIQSEIMNNGISSTAKVSDSDIQSEMWMEIYHEKLCKEKYLDACYFTSKCWEKKDNGHPTVMEIIEEIKGLEPGKLKRTKEKNSVKFIANRYRELAAEFLGRHREEFPRLALPQTWKTQLKKLK